MARDGMDPLLYYTFHGLGIASILGVIGYGIYFAVLLFQRLS